MMYNFYGEGIGKRRQDLEENKKKESLCRLCMMMKLGLELAPGLGM
jgi:hypothetical protein